MLWQLAVVAVIALLNGCALPMSVAHGTLCEEAIKHCNPTEPNYDDCVNRAGCGVQ